MGWCEGLANIIWTMRQQIKQLELLNAQIADPASEANMLPELLSGITDLLSNLVTGTFIIEKQSPQVMKTNTRFTATVRLLVGGQLNVHMASPSVSVSIISENQANQLLKTPAQSTKRREDYSSGEILNGQGNMEFHATTRQVSVTFWEWFYRVMNLTANHMRGPWSEGYIMAFVSKNRAEELLTACVGGTFLLRFSDSELGGVTIA